MHDIAAQHAASRALTFFDQMREYTTLPADNRPIVSPCGVLVAEMAANLSILQANTARCMRVSVKLNDLKAAGVFDEMALQLELVAVSLQNLGIY